MTDLQKVSNATAAEYDSFLEGAESRAKSLGATITDVIGATSEFSRLGYNLDESSTLGDAAVKYLNVSEYSTAWSARVLFRMWDHPSLSRRGPVNLR